MSMTIDEATRARYAEQGWGTVRNGLGAHPALVIVDMQVDFVDPDSPSTCAPMAQARLPAMRRLLDAAREAGVPIFFTQGLVKPDLSDVGLWKGRAHRTGLCQIEGSRGADIVPDLAPRDGETVIPKRRPSGFFGTELHEKLRGRGVDTVLLAGASMSGCVRATAVDAFSHDYLTSIVRECVIDRTEKVLESNLFDIDAKYVDAISLDEALEHLAMVRVRAGDGARS
jgi:maleamate amidohydrolase